eukprot:7326398-Prymnesium_polylepis.1
MQTPAALSGARLALAGASSCRSLALLRTSWAAATPTICSTASVPRLRRDPTPRRVAPSLLPLDLADLGRPHPA